MEQKREDVNIRDKMLTRMLKLGILAAVLLVFLPILLYLCFITPSKFGIQ